MPCSLLLPVLHGSLARGGRRGKEGGGIEPLQQAQAQESDTSAHTIPHVYREQRPWNRAKPPLVSGRYSSILILVVIQVGQDALIFVVAPIAIRCGLHIVQRGDGASERLAAR